jgi:uncharacterized membrane protein YhdT
MQNRFDSFLAGVRALFVFGGVGVLVLALVLRVFPGVILSCMLLAGIIVSSVGCKVAAGVFSLPILFGVSALGVAVLFAAFQWVRRKLISRAA